MLLLPSSSSFCGPHTETSETSLYLPRYIPSYVFPVASCLLIFLHKSVTAQQGAGVGKGRQIAALTKEFMKTGGKRVLWVSTSSDLRYDARRDLDDMHSQKIEVYPQVCVSKTDLFKQSPTTPAISVVAHSVQSSSVMTHDSRFRRVHAA